MKTMIQVKNEYGVDIWIALDGIQYVQERNDRCEIAASHGTYFREGTIEQLVAATKSSMDVRGEMRLIGLEGK